MPDPGVLVLEDGTGVSTANTYVTRAEADAYHTEMGNSAWISKSSTYDTSPTADDIAGDKALVRATRAINRLYRTRWKGTPADYDNQALDWPRAGVEVEGNAIDDEDIPNELKEAQYEAALRELASSGVLTPDMDRGGAIKSVKAGSVEVEYQSGASSSTYYTAIEGILANLLSDDDQLTLG